MKTVICSICNEQITSNLNGWDGGHNANPINEGRCCGVCNDLEVVPARLEAWAEYKKKIV